MGAAMLRGALRSPDLSPAEVIIYNRTTERMKPLLNDFPDLNIAQTPADVFQQSTIILLAIKPHAIPQLLSQTWLQCSSHITHSPTLLSIASGITIQQMHQCCPGLTNIVRAMPNTPSLIGSGICAVSAEDSVPAEVIDSVHRLLGHCGFVFNVPENHIETIAALAGCGPAYMYTIIDAMSDAGVALGLTRQLATRLAAETMLGSAKLVLQSHKHPMELRDEVASPGGTTIEGLNALDEFGARHAVIQAVKAAHAKAERMTAQLQN